MQRWLALAVVLALAGCGGSGATATATAAKCLGSHGWKVEHLSSHALVALLDQAEGRGTLAFRLTYKPPAEPAFALPGWTGYEPMSKKQGGFLVPLPACFRRFMSS